MLPSPCVGICQIDERFGLCQGCARSRSEVANWAHASREMINRVWAALPTRRAHMGLGIHRLRWGLDDLRTFSVNTLRFGGGTWLTGVYGAAAEFSVGDCEVIALHLLPHRHRSARATRADRMSGRAKNSALQTGTSRCRFSRV
jgi:predicted Fe-S protein YdhL (DUF1289 family)